MRNLKEQTRFCLFPKFFVFYIKLLNCGKLPVDEGFFFLPFNICNLAFGFVCIDWIVYIFVCVLSQMHVSNAIKG